MAHHSLGGLSRRRGVGRRGEENGRGEGEGKSVPQIEARRSKFTSLRIGSAAYLFDSIPTRPSKSIRLLLNLRRNVTGFFERVILLISR